MQRIESDPMIQPEEWYGRQVVTVRQDDVTTGSNDRILLQVSQTRPPTAFATGKVAVQTDTNTLTG